MKSTSQKNYVIQKEVRVFPIILRPCGWLDNSFISSLLSSPTDGKPITEQSNYDSALQNVYDNLKEAIELENKIKSIEQTSNFKDFLEDCELIKYLHKDKETLHLNDIFVSPELQRFNDIGENDKVISSSDLTGEFNERPKLMISGETQSGKTTLCKTLYKQLREFGFIPVYLCDSSEKKYKGLLKNRIDESF